MRIKSYFVDSVEQAMEKARVELGPEAMLMNSKPVAPEARHLGRYEVVFALAPDSAPDQRSTSVTTLPSSLPGRDAVAQELAELRRQIETVKRSMSRQSFHVRWTGPGTAPELGELYSRLLACEFSDEMCQELVQAVETRSGRERRGVESLSSAVADELAGRFETNPRLGVPGAERRVVALVGPPGAGKTCTIVKLALKYGLTCKKPLQILSTDAYRVGGSEQLRAYAGIIGVAFQTVEAVAGLAQALEECSGKELVLIDTPGFGPNDMEEAAELAMFVSRHRQIEVQLVLPALLRSSVMTRTFEMFSAFAPKKLIFTNMDGIGPCGGVLEQAMRTSLPISYLACGQQIPEDLQEPSKESLIQRVVEGWPQAELSAA